MCATSQGTPVLLKAVLKKKASSSESSTRRTFIRLCSPLANITETISLKKYLAAETHCPCKFLTRSVANRYTGGCEQSPQVGIDPMAMVIADPYEYFYCVQLKRGD